MTTTPIYELDPAGLADMRPELRDALFAFSTKLHSADITGAKSFDVGTEEGKNLLGEVESLWRSLVDASGLSPDNRLTA